MRVLLITLCILLSAFAGVSQTSLVSGADWSIRPSMNYQYFSFNGLRTNSNCIGGIIEKRINYESTFGLSVHYVSRMENAEIQNANLPEYSELVHFSPWVRKYFNRALDGAYSGFALGLGIPSGRGTQWEFGAQFGYLVYNKHLAIDIQLQMGFGSFRYNKDVTSDNGLVVNTVYYADYGFFFRPGISIGFAK